MDNSSLSKDVSEHKTLSKGHSGKSKGKNRSSNKPSTEIVVHDVVGSSSDGFSVSWTAEFKTTRNAHGTKVDAFYTDPVSGYVFRSEKDVLLYLENGDISKCAIKPKKRDGTDPEATKYVDPVSEHCLLTNGHSTLSEKERNSISKHSMDVVEVAVDGLPPGWIKEIKTKKTANGIRRDPLYTDPVSGYIFRSKLDALRYIETGDIKKCAVKPSKRVADDPESKDVRVTNYPGSTKDVRVANDPVSTKDVSFPSPPVDKRYSLRSSGGQDSIGEKLNEEIPAVGEENCVMGKSPASRSSKRKKVGTVSTDAMFTGSITEVPEAKQPDRRERKSRKTAQSSEPESKDSKQDNIVTADNTVTVDNIAASNAVTDNLHGMKFPKNTKNKKISRKTLTNPRKSEKRKVQSFPARSEKKIVQNTPGRMSKRLAGSQPEMPANLQLSERSLRAAIKTSCETEEDILSIITMNGVAGRASPPLDSELAPETPVRRSGVVELNMPPFATVSTAAEGVPQQLDHEPVPGVADIVSMVVESISKIEETEINEEPSAEKQAVPEEKTGGQVHVKQDTENPRTQNPQVTYPFLDSWSDPCLDFAFKTLTGALPVNNTPSYQSQNQTGTTSYFQRNEYPRQSESPKPPGFQNGIPFHPLNPVEQHVQVEQLPRPPSPPPGFTLPLFGGFGSQQRDSEDRNDNQRNFSYK